MTLLRKNCIVCEKEIFRSNNNRSTKLRRREGSITCSKVCSKVYGRVYHYILKGIRRKLKNK